MGRETERRTLHGAVHEGCAEHDGVKEQKKPDMSLGWEKGFK